MEISKLAKKRWDKYKFQENLVVWKFREFASLSVSLIFPFQENLVVWK